MGSYCCVLVLMSDPQGSGPCLCIEDINPGAEVNVQCPSVDYTVVQFCTESK